MENYWGIFVVLALFLSIIPYDYILKKFKINKHDNNEKIKIFVIKAIIYWSIFILINYLLMKVFL